MAEDRSIKFPADLYDELMALAEENNRTLRGQLRTIMAEWKASQPKRGKVIGKSR